MVTPRPDMHHHRPPPENVPGPLGTALRGALERYLRHQLGEGELHGAVRRYALRAKGEGLLAEEVILRFNELWASIPEVQRAPPRMQRELRADLISECIEDYYEGME
jgi:hypothetical protein